jgi:hypothetical protein
MSGKKPSFRTASWLLRHLGCSWNHDAMLGDIQEQFARGRSRLWFWQEVCAAIFAGAYVSIFSSRSSVMKRAIVWITVLMGVFLLGYVTARSPFIVHEEMPSADLLAEMKEQRQLADAHRRHIKKEGRAYFLKMAVRGAELEYGKSGSAASKAKLDDLRSNLEQAQRQVQDAPSR